MPAVRTDEWENFFVLLDPAWELSPREEVPPFEAVLGVWPVLAGDGLGRFRANPDYEPSDDDAPTDPIDATLDRAEDTAAALEQLQVLLRDSLVEVAVDELGTPLLSTAPDDMPCLLVTTSGRNHRYAPGLEWRAADLEALVAALEDDVDVLLNPGAPRMTRLTGDFVREALGLDDAEATALLLRSGAQRRQLTVVPWTIES